MVYLHLRVHLRLGKKCLLPSCPGHSVNTNNLIKSLLLFQEGNTISTKLISLAALKYISDVVNHKINTLGVLVVYVLFHVQA